MIASKKKMTLRGRHFGVIAPSPRECTLRLERPGNLLRWMDSSNDNIPGKAPVDTAINRHQMMTTRRHWWCAVLSLDVTWICFLQARTQRARRLKSNPPPPGITFWSTSGFFFENRAILGNFKGKPIFWAIFAVKTPLGSPDQNPGSAAVIVEFSAIYCPTG